MRALLLLLVLFGYAGAADLTPERAKDIYIVAYGQCPRMADMNAGCPREWLNEMPSVRQVPQPYLCGLKQIESDCSILGYYKSGHVLVSDRLDYDKPYDISVLFHEYIHHLQWLKSNKTDFMDCGDNYRREVEAHSLHVHLLERLNDYTGAGKVRILMAQLRGCQ